MNTQKFLESFWLEIYLKPKKFYTIYTLLVPSIINQLFIIINNNNKHQKNANHAANDAQPLQRLNYKISNWPIRNLDTFNALRWKHGFNLMIRSYGNKLSNIHNQQGKKNWGIKIVAIKSSVSVLINSVSSRFEVRQIFIT